jgi:hypothetical protein
MDSRCPSPLVGGNYLEGQLCQVCLGITEDNTRFDVSSSDDNDNNRRVYAHHPHLFALEGSALNVCTCNDLSCFIIC